jgi:hypothetical protein
MTTATSQPNQPLRMHLIWEVLEGAKDAGDAEVLAAARRLVRANMLGWRKHAQPADYELVKSFAEWMPGGAMQALGGSSPASG